MSKSDAIVNAVSSRLSALQAEEDKEEVRHRTFSAAFKSAQENLDSSTQRLAHIATEIAELKAYLLMERSAK